MAVKLSLTPGDPDTLLHQFVVLAKNESAQARVAIRNADRRTHNARYNAFLESLSVADAAMRSVREGGAVELRPAQTIIEELIAHKGEAGETRI